jgi:hypothetical protein
MPGELIGSTNEERVLVYLVARETGLCSQSPHFLSACE